MSGCHRTSASCPCRTALRSALCLTFGPTTSTTSSSISSASTPSPTPTLNASDPSFAEPTSSPSASCTRCGNVLLVSDLLQRSGLHGGSSCLDRRFRTRQRSRRDRTRQKDRHLKFYELRDNLAVQASVTTTMWPVHRRQTRERQYPYGW